MRCPKCGYNSFDHNLVCPKCRKDLTTARNLLGIAVPAPGGIDFFRAAEDRAVFAEPEEAVPVEVFPAVAPPLMEGAVFPADDIAPVDEIEEIEPEEYLEEDEEDIAPVEEADDDEDDEDISPMPSPEGNFAQELAQAQAADDEIEIELDDDETGVEAGPLPVSGDFAAAMTQIKNTLVATGDLEVQDVEDVEAVEIEPGPEEGPEAVVLDDDEADDDEIDPIEAELMGEAPVGIDDADLNELHDLVTDMDLDDLEKRIADDNA